MAKDSGRNSSGVVVIGLGRFGTALALELVEQDIEVLGIDGRPKIVQDLATQLTHVVEADSTDEQALRQLSVHEFDRVVIGIGNDVEASILTASLVLQMGVPEHLGQGDQRGARPDPHPARGAPRGPPRTRHGPTGRAPGRRPDAGLHRVRRGLRDDQNLTARRDPGSTPRSNHRPVPVRDHRRRRETPRRGIHLRHRPTPSCTATT